MTAPAMRLRVLFVSPERHLLVIDKLSQPMTRELAETLIAGTKTPATSGTLVFPGEVEIPDIEESGQGIQIHPDEIDALVRMAERHDGEADANVLGLLAERATEAAR